MYQGRTLMQLAEELDRRAEAKKDYCAPTKRMHLSYIGEEPKLVLNLEDTGFFGMKQLAERQMGTWAGVPTKYYDKMRTEAPDLLLQNMNHWLEEATDKRLLRTLDHEARAFLSDRYRAIDNEDVTESALNALAECGNQYQIASCDVTDDHLYIKAVFPTKEADVKVGDTVRAGVMVKNSEVGKSSLVVQPFVERLVCLNGMVVNDGRFRRNHVGRHISGDESHVVYRDETVRADDRALLMKIQDTIKSASNEVFDAAVNAFREAAGSSAIVKPIDAVEEVTKQFRMGEKRKDTLVERLIRDGDYTKWGMANAITNLANDADDYEEATELEEIGGRIITLNNNEWRRIAEAA